jgi:hypothetical protein
MIRHQVTELVQLGAFPSEDDADQAQIKRQQQLLEGIEAPVSDDEARELIKVFGPDTYYGLAWTVLHLVEGAPNWPLPDCLESVDNQWIQILRRRLENTKRFRSSE